MIDINKLASRFYMVTGSSFKTITTKMKVYFLPLFGNILSLFTYNYLNVCVIYSHNYLLYPLFNLRLSISKSLARFWLNDYYLFQKHTKMTIEVLTPHDLITLKDTIINEVIDKVQNNPNERKTWLKSVDAAEFLKCSPATLKHFRRENLIPFSKIGGRYYYSVEDLQALLNNNMKKSKDENNQNRRRQ